MSRISEIALAFLGRGGKRLRPRLCRRVFEICGGTGAIEPVCDAVECFHKASLIHDDIQDGDEERYGRPTTWKEHGVGVAIAAGDWLVAHGYRLIVKSGFPSAASMLEAVVESHMRLCEGQGDDLLAPGANPLASDQAFDRAGYLSTCARKTGEAFALAAQLGARAAGAALRAGLRHPLPDRRRPCGWGVVARTAPPARGVWTTPCRRPRGVPSGSLALGIK